jgi:hypothetical protein
VGKLGSALAVDLGGATDGTTVELDLSDSALGFNVVVQSNGALGIERVETPAGAVVVDSFTATNSTLAVGEGSGGIGTISIPDNDAAEQTSMPAGKWKITIGGKGDGGHVLARIQTTGDGDFHGGTLDLHLHIPIGLTVAGHVVAAATAGSDGALGKRVDAFYAELERSFGIERGLVTFHEAPAELVAINDEAAVAAAASVSRGLPEEQAVHLLLTNELEGGDLLGLSPGIPGVSSLTGTPESGIMAALYDDSTAVEDGNAWLHELGHFIGLQHTSEEDGRNFDALGDTPKCPKIVDGNDDVCPDESNLMFPTIFLGSPSVSKSQKLIFQSSPVYAALPSAGVAVRRLEAPLPPPTAPYAITHSGRPLTSVERWIGGTFCGASEQSPRALVDARGPAQAVVDLERVAADADLPARYRRKATRMLDWLRSGDAPAPRLPFRLH